MTFVRIDIYNQHMEKLTTTINEIGKRVRQLDAVEVPTGGGVPVHNLLSASHLDTVVNGATRGSLIYGNATPAWDELVHPGINRHLQTTATDVLWRQDIYMNDGSFIGVSGDVRIKFDTTNGRVDVILGEAVGSDEFRVCDSSTAAVFTVDSDGNIYAIGTSFDVGDSSPTFGGRTLTVPATGTAVLAGASGASPRVAYWTNAYTIDGDAGITLDVANNVYVVADAGGVGNSFATAFLGFNSSGAQDYAYFSGCYVGINDTTPSFHLDVNGKIGITGTQTVYNAGASAAFSGTVYFGDGGGSLIHTIGDSAYYNTAVGYGSLLSNTGGDSNTSLGYHALRQNTTGSKNTAVGVSALQTETNGTYNTAVGDQALWQQNGAGGNSAIGAWAGYAITTGIYNAFLGYGAGRFTTVGNNSTPSYSVFIGFDSQALANGDTNEVVIGGNTPVGNGSNTTTIGTSSTTDTYIFGNYIIENQHFIGITGDVRTVWDSTNGYIIEQLDDAAGADEWRVYDSAPALVASIDSNGDGFFAGNVVIGTSIAASGNIHINANDPKIYFDDNAGGAQRDFSIYDSASALYIRDETAGVDRMTIYSTGLIGVNIMVPTAQLHVDQSSSTGAIPTIKLDQADESEEVIYIIGASNAGTADRTLVKASEYPTPGALLAWIKCVVEDTRVGGLGTIDIWVPGYAVPT